MKFLLALGAALAALSLVPSALAAGPTVFFDNQSSTVPQADLVAAVGGFQVAVSRDLEASWGTDAQLTTDPALPADMTVEIDDDATCWGCLGYHDVVDGKPISYIFAGTSAQYNESWQLVASHELDEMLVDPWINHFARWKDRSWIVEVCDPVESGAFAYTVNGVVVSDFITPAWYGGVRGKPVDFTRGLKHPGQIGRHGYASFLKEDGTWGQVFNSRVWSDPA